ncbi:MAG: RNA polymerase sigma factor [Myxococcaceae bacterium]
MRKLRDAWSDEALMERYVAGSRAAFDTLFRRHAPSLRKFLGRSTRDSATADDLTQGTFINVVRGRHTFRANASFRTWLFAIATNVLREHRRGRTRLVLMPLGVLPEGEGAMPAVPDPGLARALVTALESVPSHHVRPLWLHEVEGLGFAEIGRREATTVAAVKLRAHRARVALRSRLQPLLDAA